MEGARYGDHSGTDCMELSEVYTLKVDKQSVPKTIETIEERSDA
jgi:hypothetical protein